MIHFDKVVVETSHPLAKDSPDHLRPRGTAQDNSQNFRFNEKLYSLYDKNIGLKVLDLGCSGGGFIRRCLDDGCFAIGLEGSDFSKKMCRANWPILANHFLFTTDITKPYQILTVNQDQKEVVKFEVITMWEVLEHLKEGELSVALDNIKHHLALNGILAVSISTEEQEYKGVTLHQTVKSEVWWIDYFQSKGLFRSAQLESFFNGQYIRCPRQIFTPSDSFNCVFVLDPKKVPTPPPLTLKNKFLDRWIYSRPYYLIRRLLGLPPSN